MITEERVINLEATLARFMDQTSNILAAIHEDIAEIRVSNARTDRQLLEMQQQADKVREEWSKHFDEQNERAHKAHQEWNERFEKERKESNKRWAEISDSMGTLIEDMVAPCGFQLAKAIFADQEAQTCAIRLK